MLTGGALGVVFGDIGTSPLYTLKTILLLSGDNPTPEVILGLLSLIFWTLILVTSVKYAIFAMRIDNNGEGGIMALTSLALRTTESPRLAGGMAALASKVDQLVGLVGELILTLQQHGTLTSSASYEAAQEVVLAVESASKEAQWLARSAPMLT